MITLTEAQYKSLYAVDTHIVDDKERAEAFKKFKENL